MKGYLINNRAIKFGNADGIIDAVKRMLAGRVPFGGCILRFGTADDAAVDLMPFLMELNGYWGISMRSLALCSTFLLYILLGRHGSVT